MGPQSPTRRVMRATATKPWQAACNSGEPQLSLAFVTPPLSERLAVRTDGEVGAMLHPAALSTLWRRRGGGRSASWHAGSARAGPYAPGVGRPRPKNRQVRLVRRSMPACVLLLPLWHAGPSPYAAWATARPELQAIFPAGALAPRATGTPCPLCIPWLRTLASPTPSPGFFWTPVVGSPTRTLTPGWEAALTAAASQISAK